MKFPRTDRKSTRRSTFPGWSSWIAGLGLGTFLIVLGLVLGNGRAVGSAAAVGAAGAASIAILVWDAERRERRDWREPLRKLADRLREAETRLERFRSFHHDRPELDELIGLIDRFIVLRSRPDEPPTSWNAEDSFLNVRNEGSGTFPTTASARLTRSGLFEADPSRSDSPEAAKDTPRGGVVLNLDASEMVCRLEPKELRWLESKPSERNFLGYSIERLQEKSFLEIVHPDDRELARAQLFSAIERGEAHGLIYRIRTASGETKAIEVNVGVRYEPETMARHLRCHITDVTAKLKADRDLRRRTKQLMKANQSLVRANAVLIRMNRELGELKDRYGDLYQNAPVMYFSIDRDKSLIDCNDTMLRTLGYAREELIGRQYGSILPEARRAAFDELFETYLREGRIETASVWRKADGSSMDVWITATAVIGPDGSPIQSRSIAQDVTARRALEAELREKNERLARAVGELSRKNKELDEFGYVVSHDLLEPLRTLTAFSDFLLRDHGDRLNADGREYVQYIVDASRRMRALINDLLKLSRAGIVAKAFDEVNLEDVVARIQADFAELARARKGAIRVDGPLPIVWGDQDRIGQLFGNLIGNGLKYHRGDGPLVEIGAEPPRDDQPGPDETDSRRFATLFVRDNGIGIDPKFHGKIFEMFRRLHPTEEFEGTGAGLAICQKIVQAHGGRIWVESELGRGSIFRVTLPTPPLSRSGLTRAVQIDVENQNQNENDAEAVTRADSIHAR